MDTLDALIAALTLEQIEVNLFRGQTPNGPMMIRRIYGGQVIAQALMAAYRTVENRPCHSLQAYFIRPGNPDRPVLYDVERSRDGKSFTTRRVIAIQGGEQILNLAASFQVPEAGLEHAAPAPDAPDPESLESDAQFAARLAAAIPEAARDFVLRERPIEVRREKPRNPFQPEVREPRQRLWFRTSRPIGDDPILSQVLLAYATDASLLDTGTLPHGVSYFTRNLQMASLDHALWFHRPFNFSDWHLYDMDSPSASGARAFTRGMIFSRDGTLVASAVQEGLIRLRPERPSGA